MASMTAPLGVPVVRSKDIPDGRYRPGTSVTLLGIREHEATATRIVRAALADVLAWLTNPPDLRTGAELHANLHASTTVTPPAFLTRTPVTITVRECGPCIWCGTPTVRYRQVGHSTPLPLACKGSHRDAAKASTRAAMRGDKSTAERARVTAEKEEARKAVCHRPDKVPYKERWEADVALRKIRADGAATPTLHVYGDCPCGWFHLGSKAKTLRARISKSAEVKKAAARKQRRSA